MPGTVLEQLNELRRQIEEDYRMDMAALERLSRHSGHAPATASASGPIPVSNSAQLAASWVKSAPPATPLTNSKAPEPQPDDLDSSLRTMFANYR